jgi:hypothetical protein
MDDNNKYNRNKDYEPDNFDDEVAFPARRNNAPERSSDIQEDYGDNFDNDVKFVGDYDEDAVQMPEIDFEDDMETPLQILSNKRRLRFLRFIYLIVMYISLFVHKTVTFKC